METVSAQGNFKAALLMSQPQKGVCVVYCSMYSVAGHFVWCLTGSVAGAGRFCSGHPSPLLFPLVPVALDGHSGMGHPHHESRSGACSDTSLWRGLLKAQL